MELAELETKHPRIFRACVDEGVQQERDRVVAHLIAGEKVGDLRAALAAIQSGAELTIAYMSRYLVVGRNRADIEARHEDNAAVEAALVNVKRQSTGGDPFEKQVADRFAALIDGADVRIEDLEGGHE